MNNPIAQTPEPPYFAVIFTSVMNDGGKDAYNEIGDELMEMVTKQPGFLGVESVRNQDGIGITVSYWESLESIKKWKDNELHKVAQKAGQKAWYKNFATRICKVEKLGLFKE